MNGFKLGSLSPLAVLTAGLALTVAASCASRPKPAPPGDPSNGALTSADTAPAEGESCAAYVQRTSPGVRCQALFDDTSRCSCEIVPGLASANTGAGDGSGDMAQNDPLVGGSGGSDGSDGSGSTNPPPNANANAAIIQFATGSPPDTTARCISDVCPIKDPVKVASGYPPINLVQNPQTVRFEFAAKNHVPKIFVYQLVPGENVLDFDLGGGGGGTTPAGANAATLKFSGAPEGTTVECISGACPDNASHSVSAPFPAIPVEGNAATVLLRFKAPGFRADVFRYQLQRGPNLIPIDLDPITRDKGKPKPQRGPRKKKKPAPAPTG